MRTFILSILSTLLLLSCSNDNMFLTNETELNPKENSLKIGINHFDSRDDLLKALNNSSQGRRAISPIGGIPKDSNYTIETPVGEIQYADLNDEILNLEHARSFNIIDSTELVDNNLTVYEAMGYDTIVPDIQFARLLNIKGEIEVSDTVYKISPKGTYFFKASLEPYFTRNYEAYENTEGQLIDDKTYLIDPIGIYRYKTFSVPENVDLGGDIELDLGTLYIPNNSAPTLASQVQWDNCMEYTSSFHHGFSKWWHNLFGDGVSGKYKFSNKRRLLGKIYDYNYIIYRTSGAFAKMQKKNWIGWSGTEAQTISLTWSNVVLEHSYEVKPPQNYYSNQKLVTELFFQNINIPEIIQGNVPVVNIFGYEFSENELKSIVNFSKNEIISFLKRKTGKNVNSSARCYVLYGKQTFVTIIPDECIEMNNSKVINKTFKKNWSFVITYNPFLDYGNWYNWINFIKNQESQGFKLLTGQIKVAAKFDNNVGAFKITFVNTL
ncbi:MAG: hypothetical protein II453_03410 [Alphaproteobacteria bacterium]|nr:hypothetical protein [Alphaproteobacteria bacterium]